MIAKAVVEEVIDSYNIRVRIPSIDRVYQSSVHVESEDLDVAVVCTLPHCEPNIRVGDIVIVAYDNSEEDTIILGHLYRTKETETYANIMLSKLTVNDEAYLPIGTTIGEIEYFDMLQLRGVKENIQKQLDVLNERINALLDKS